MVARLTEPWNAGSACYLRILGEISPCLTGPEVSRSLQTRNEQVRGSSPLVGFKEKPRKWRGFRLLVFSAGRHAICQCVPGVCRFKALVDHAQKMLLSRRGDRPFAPGDVAT